LRHRIGSESPDERHSEPAYRRRPVRQPQLRHSRVEIVGKIKAWAKATPTCQQGEIVVPMLPRANLNSLKVLLGAKHTSTRFAPFSNRKGLVMPFAAGTSVSVTARSVQQLDWLSSPVKRKR
jgi:hypothetical protein